MSRLLPRLPFLVALLGGLVILGVAVSRSAVDAGEAGDELVELATPILSDEGLSRLRTDLDEVRVMATLLADDGVARLAELSGQDRDEFLGELRRSAPAVHRGIEELPESADLADRIVSNLERRQSEFESAASLPGPGLTLEQASWSFLLLGAALVAAGLLGLLRPRRWLAAALAALGVLLVAMPLALQYPAKTSDTDALLDSLRPFSEEKIDERQAARETGTEVFEGMQRTVVPDVAEAAGTTPEAVMDELGRVDPRLSTAGLQRADKLLGRFDTLVRFSETIQPLLVQTTELPARSTTWMLLAPGAALVVSGGIALARRQWG